MVIVSLGINIRYTIHYTFLATSEINRFIAMTDLGVRYVSKATLISFQQLNKSILFFHIMELYNDNF